MSAGVPPANGSIDRELKISTSALGRAGARPAKVTRGGSAGKRLFGRGVQAGCRGFEGDRGGCLAACASSPHSQLRIYDETTHLEPCCAANSSAASIVTAQPPDSTSQFSTAFWPIVELSAFGGTSESPFGDWGRWRVRKCRPSTCRLAEPATHGAKLYDTARKMKKVYISPTEFCKVR